MPAVRSCAAAHRALWRVAVGCVVLCVATPPARAQDGSAATATIAGVVRDEAGNEIAAAELVVLGTALRVLTDARGAFVIRQVPGGPVQLQARRLGYAPRVLHVVASPAVTEPVDVVLTTVARLLPTVEVRGARSTADVHLAGFNQRRAAGVTGHFITRAEIDAQRPHRTTDLLRRVPGMNFSAPGLGETDVRMRDRRCNPLVWVDGVAASSAYFDPDNINPQAIAGIEVYNGLASVPALFMGPELRGACGVIAIWSRIGEPVRRPRRKRTLTPAQVTELVDSRAVLTADQVGVPVRADPNHPVQPVYPDELWRAGTAGLVIAEFIVGADGHVEPASIGIVSSPHRLFTEAVTSALLGAMFLPATADGTFVRQVVQLPFRFVSTASASGTTGRSAW